MNPAAVLPADHADARLVGRLFDPDVGGPCVVAVRGEDLIDISAQAPTMSHLLDGDPLAVFDAAERQDRRWPLADVLATAPDTTRPHLLAPCDLQPLKACGVTFARSMIERVIEERAKGDHGMAAAIRKQIGAAIGSALSDIRAGSDDAVRAREVLQAAGIWSQYLEVGIGKDAEVFTKAPVLSAVGHAAEIGILPSSVWNNPEPEIVLAVDSAGTVKGACLGNDVNLRDIEGRSALLLGKAKDNNASAALGPFLRLFDEGFALDDVRAAELEMTVTGTDGYVLTGRSSMREISRDPLDLVRQVRNRSHQYPDGFMLYLGTLFAPTEDRDVPGEGFTHKIGDLVEIESPRLGRLINTVTSTDEAAEWTFGLSALLQNLAARGLLARDR